ncbi:MAG: UDP-N-acetylmuramoyl-tripeptide--D-alanyl-D-alanine ligase [Candidatus Binatia bacterium]
MSWSREEILLATGGEMVREGREAVLSEVVIDSGKVERGSVFIALKGERFDGHAFLRDALRRGASCLVVHQRPAVSLLRGATVIKVSDTLEALGDLAHYRRKMVAPKVLAITGSNGKTTTKEMVAAILERASIQGRSLRGRILKTEGNYNNLVGLPLTLLRLRGRERVAVLELGTSRPGEIKRLTRIADPDIGLITSVAPAHLTGLRGLAGVAREKGELFRGINPRGVAVVNLDDPWVHRLGEKFRGEKVTYGKRGEVAGESWKALGMRGMEFTLRVGRERRRIRLRLSGEYNLSNAVGAAAMAYGLGADLEAMRKGLEDVKPFPMRMAMEKWRGIGIINDSYNANPASMEAALKTLAEIGGGGERVAILGDMLELGRESRKSHLELGKQVARYRMGRLYLLGEQADHVKEGALLAGMEEERVTIGKNHREIAWMVRGHVRRGDWLLFKGSRGMNMEKVLAAFKEMGE